MENLKKWRRELHQIPEIGLREEKTAAYLRQELEKLEYTSQSIINTGTIVFINNHCKETIAFRSDIDGIAINEENNVDYSSTHTGIMHACGHDGHMSALLGLAKRLKESKDKFHYNFLLIFQPAEESPGGAKQIVKSDILKKYHVKAIFGMHLMPMFDEGKIACKSGPLMAMCGELDVKITGKGTHAGLPHDGIDSIVIAAHAIEQYQSVISRLISPFSPAILNVGKIVGGTTRNSIASETLLKGTIRCYDEKLYQEILNHVEDIHQGLKRAYKCNIEWSCPPNYPPVINDKSLYERFKKLIQPEDYIELTEALMLSEDFSFYQQAIPGIFFYLGTKTNQYNSGLHTETFNFNEEVLEKAVDLYYKIATNI